MRFIYNNQTTLFTDEIDREKLETSDIERNIRNLQNDMLKLNMLLHKERGTQHELYQSNVLMENDFVGSLKVRINNRPVDVTSSLLL